MLSPPSSKPRTDRPVSVPAERGLVKPLVLIVEDEQALVTLLRYNFEAAGYEVATALDGEEALLAIAERRPDLIVLDWMLPSISGLEVCRQVRRKPETRDVPVIMLTARGEEADRVRGLDSGADDYVTKPFGVDELMARIRAALRHRLQEQGTAPVFRSGDLSVDLVHRRVSAGGREVHLSPKEYDILRQFVMHAGKVLTHRHLLREVWGVADSADVQALRVFIRQLRQKLEADPEQPRHILTEPGAGYRLQLQE